MKFLQLNTTTKLTIAIQVMVLLLAVFFNLKWVLGNGLLSDAYQSPMIHRVLWDSSIVLNPLAILLLFFRPKIGLLLSLFIFSTDLLHNVIFYWEVIFYSNYNLDRWFGANWMFIAQAVMTLFLFIFLKRNLKACAN
jgi:hypothetical protein